MYQCSTITAWVYNHRNTTSLLCEVPLFLESQNTYVEALTDMLNPNHAVTAHVAVLTSLGSYGSFLKTWTLHLIPLMALILRYTDSPVFFLEESVVCSWFKGGKLLQPVANLAKEFMSLESLNSCKILDITDGKGLGRIIWTRVPKQDCFVWLILQSFVQTDFEKLLYDIHSQC